MKPKTKEQLEEEVQELTANLNNMTQQRDELLEKIKAAEESERNVIAVKDSILANREELVTANGILKRELDSVIEHSAHQARTFPKDEIETALLDAIRGAEIQRLFHNPTDAAMRQAAELLVKTLAAL